MAERDYLDIDDWLRAGGMEGTGQQMPSANPGSSMEPYDPWKAAGQQPMPGTAPRPGHIWVQMPDGSWVETPNGVHPPGDNGLSVPAAGPPGQTPAYSGGSGGGGWSSGGGGGDWGYLTEPFTGKPPEWRAGPTFQPPTFVTPPPFSYKQFQAPTKDSIYADPSYDFRVGEGKRALEQSAAGRGVLRTGGTLKDLVNYGQNAASQEYSNIFDRSVQAHNLGLNQELGTYATNYGVTRDAYDRLYEGNKATFEGLQRDNLLMNQRDFDNFLANFDIFEKNRRRAGDYVTWAAGQGD
jgi:hypothetical protein